ncbi:MAG: DNA primase, partial [Phycisphaerae bacterium]
MYALTDAKEEIRQRVDLVELVSEHVALRQTGNSFKGLCPFHKEKTPSFHVVPAKGLFHCFGCKASGDAYKFLQLREGVSFPEAVRMLADRVGVEITSRHDHHTAGPTRSDLARVNAWAADFFRNQLQDAQLGQSARQYLLQRGISDEMSERFNLGLATDANAALCQSARLAGLPESLLESAGLIKPSQNGGFYDTFRHRLIFPINDTTRRVIGFGGRALGDAPAKYLNTAGTSLFDKGRVLYGLDLARASIAQAGRTDG